MRPVDLPSTAHRVRTRAAAGLVLVLGLAAACTGHDGRADAPAPRAPTGARDSLPRVAPGVGRDGLWAGLAHWPPGHRFRSGDDGVEGWEWSGPDGMRVEAWLDGARVVAVVVSRTWGEGAPPVDGYSLPDSLAGRPLAELDAAIGRGLLVERSWSLGNPGDGEVLESYCWAIHDRGIDTGLYLVVRVRDGVVVSVRHRWSRA